MRFTALGGGDSIGGSCYLLEAAGRRVVVDCGIRFEKRPEGNAIFLPDLRRIRNERVDLILITHAHLDHIGGAPRLALQHPEAAIFMTAPTLAIGTVLLEDSLKIRKQEERRALRQLPPAVFNRRQLDWFLSRVHPIAEPAWWLSPLAGWEICFWPAGHIRGAASVLLNTPEGSVMFTGDVSAGDQPTVAGARTPDCFRPDVLVTETTYGGRDLPPREEEVKRLVGRVLDVKRRGGKVLIPAFAVGRSVDVALDLIGQGIPVYLDGMARIMAEIYHSADASWCGLDRPFPLPDLIEEGFITMVPREKEAGRYRRDSRLAGEEPAGHDFSVMVSPSGTLDGGYSLKYAKQIFNEYRSAIFFPGFLMEGTAGKQVAEIERGRAVKIGEEVFNVRCEVERFNLSAHDSADNLLARVKALAPRKVILIHGEPAAQNALRERIVAIPAFPAVFEGKTGKTIEL